MKLQLPKLSQKLSYVDIAKIMKVESLQGARGLYYYYRYAKNKKKLIY